ncbi:unnamed protein product, partial [Rotaria sp. Silwood2]
MKTRALSKEDIMSTTPKSPILQSSDTEFTETPSKGLDLPDGVTIVWLDARANSKSVDDMETKLMLEKIHPSVLTFDDVRNCLDALSKISNKKSRVFLVVSEELTKLPNTIGGMTSINGFISTSVQQWVADEFLQRESHRGPDAQKVLWIIEADCRIDGIIFAPVAQYSVHPEEKEVIFNIGSAFRIDSITLNEANNIWHIKATATNDGSHAFSEYMKVLRRELKETSEKVIFGTLLIDMGKYVTAQCYFKDLIERFSGSNHPDLSDFHYNLGLTYSFQGDLDLAEQNFLRALKYQNLVPLKQRDMVRTLNALGWVHQDSGALDEAIDFYKKAENEIKSYCQPNISWCPWQTSGCTASLPIKGQGTIEIWQYESIPFELRISNKQDPNDKAPNSYAILLKVDTREAQLGTINAQDGHVLRVRDITTEPHQALQMDDDHWHCYWFTFYGRHRI